jgi:nucleotide-binding universal stress UspA family protein
LNRPGDTIIVGVDESERARDALALGDLLAGAIGARLLIAHVTAHGQAEELLSSEELETVGTQTAKDASARVRELLEDRQADGLRVVTARSPAAGLEALARSEEASLIALASSHRATVGRVQPGGVGQRLLAGAPVPVALAPLEYAQEERRLETVGCAFDGLDESRLALEWAAGLARRAGAAMRLVAVHERMAFSNVGTGAVSGESVNRAMRRSLRERLDEAVAEVAGEVPAEAVLAEGRPVEELERAAEQMDLLVMGSRGHGPVRAVLMGSVSARLIASAPAPIVVVPRGPAA